MPNNVSNASLTNFFQPINVTSFYGLDVAHSSTFFKFPFGMFVALTKPCPLCRSNRDGIHG